MQRRPGRAALTILGIAIGVSTFSGIAISIRSARSAHAQVFSALAGGADLEVVAHGGGAFDAGVADGALKITGVETVTPVVEALAAIVQGGGPMPVMIVGQQRGGDAKVESIEIRAGTFPTGNEVLLESSFADSIAAKVGDSVSILASGGLTTLRISGTLEPRGLAQFNGGAVAMVELATAQRLFNIPGRINLLRVVLENGASVTDVRTALGRALPPGLSVREPKSRGVLSGQALHSTEISLSVISVVSLIAGACVILNAFLMNLGERRRDLAMMRSLGATRLQVTALLLREAILLGFAGAIIGLPLGAGLAAMLVAVIGQILGVRLPNPGIDLGSIIGSLVLGPGVALLATIVPARSAARREPLHDLMGVALDRAAASHRWSVVAGFVILVADISFIVALLGGALRRELVEPMLPACMAGLCAGVVLTFPAYQSRLSRWVDAILSKLLGAEGRLAVRQLHRHAGRTTLTAGVLVISIMVSLGFGNAMLISMDDISRWCRTIGNTDFFVRGSLPDPGTLSMNLVLPEALQQRVRSIPGVRHVGRMAFIPVTAQGMPIVVLTGEYSGSDLDRVPLATGSSDGLEQCLASGGVLLGTTLAQRLGLGEGDRIEIDTRQGPRLFPVCGTVTEYTAGGMNLCMGWETAARELQIPGAHLLTIFAEREQLDRVETELRELGRSEGLTIQSRAEFRRFIETYLDGLVGTLFLIMAMVFVVALLGIVNTISINVLEQTREIGILRAVAMTRRQLYRMTIGQALGVALMALVPGMVGGLLVTYLINRASYPITGFPLPFELHGLFISLVAAVTLVIGLVAAILPAIRAGRLRVIEALHYE